MKILYLQLKNFANIYTAMHKKKIEIDFTQCKNRIVLLVGENGTGKTSILSELHPFAYAGNMDVRNGSNLILKDNDGYKEIHIHHNDEIYIIKHFYKNTKKGILLKSFISKNNEELNLNGNVTSFIEYVSNELAIEQDYLKLLRLGSNVTNLIEMKSTERKNFTSDLLSDIDIYNQLFKKINEDNRVLRNLIKTVSDKIIKLNILDKDLLRSDINLIDSNIIELKNTKSSLQQELGNIEGKISTLVPEGLENFQSDLTELYAIKSDCIERIRKCKTNISSIMVILDSPITDYLTFINSKKNSIDRDIAITVTKISSYQDQRNDLYNKKDDILNQLKYLTSSLEENQLMKMYIELNDKCNELNKKFKDNVPKYSKDNLMVVLNILGEINNIAYTIYEFSPIAIKEAVRLIQNSYNVETHIQFEVSKIDKKINNLIQQGKLSSVKDNTLILFRPSGCVFNDCPYLNLYDELFTSKTNNESMVTLESKRENLIEILNVSKNIDYILVILKSNQNLINHTHIKYLNIDNILKGIEKFGDVYDERELITIISNVEEYEEYVKLQTKLIELKQEMSDITNNTNAREILVKSLKETEISISTIELTIHNLQQDFSKLEAQLKRANSLIVDGELYKSFTDELTEVHKLNESTLNNINKHETVLNNISEFIQTKKLILLQIDSTSWSIDKMERELFDKKVSLQEFETLSKERETLNEQFDDLSLIKESLSSNKGIPLLYIQLYLKNTKMYVNELLQAIYSNEEFEIDDFEINANEFNIPYFKNGIRINDVVYASQGERSFLSLALSFALITQSIKDYNILLLDELDSTLDYRNRPLFLNILEKQMSSINAEQIFLITHNDMFDSYPVDVIMTSDNKHGLSNTQNIIFQA